MKIAIITPFYPPSIGGVETIASDTAEELARRGHDVSVITTICNNVFEEMAKPGVQVENGVSVNRLRPSFLKIGYATLMKSLKKTLEKLDPNIVHTHNLHPHLFQAVKWKHELDYKVVAQLHYPGATGIDHLSARLGYRLTMRYLKMKQREIDAFIAHTNLERKWLVGEGIENRRIRKIRYPCVPCELLKYDQKGHKPKIGLSQVLLYTGRVVWRKGIHILLQALPDVINEKKNITTVITGPRNQEYYRFLLSLVNDLGLNGYVVFHGALPEEDKYGYMKSCELFVSPSIRDFTPITLVEAQALGKPVVSTAVGAISEIVKDGETGLLVEPNDPKKLAEAIRRLIQMEDEKKVMGIRAKEWVRENFLLENTIDELEKLYVDCLNG